MIAGQMGLSLYLPALPMIQSDWSLTAAQAQLTVNVYFISFGAVQLFYGPLSDHYGRKPFILLGLLISAIGALLAVYSEHFSSLLIARFVQGLGAGALPVLGRVCAKDMFAGHSFSKAVGGLSMVACGTLGLAPFLGGWLSVHFGW